MPLRRSFLAVLSLVVAAAPLPARANPSFVFDVRTGEVLKHEEAFRRWYPASLSKLMTAYVVFRALKAGEVTLESPIRMTKHAAGEPPSKMGFKPGSEMTLDNALKMMLVKSANDIAMAIAENIGGSQEAFAARMNAESARLGMTGSHWMNPNGLFDEGQYTTARDLALLVSAIRNEFPEYSPYFSIEALGVGRKVLPAYNQLVGRYDGADGMKTGFICPSGFNLVGTATRDGRTVGAVVLGSPSAQARTVMAAALLTDGFAAAGGDPKPKIGALAPYGEGNDIAANLRAEICEHKAKAAAAASGEAGEAGKTVESPFLREFDRPRRVVMVGLGGATGPVPPNQPPEALMADIPVPTARPDPNAPVVEKVAPKKAVRKKTVRKKARQKPASAKKAEAVSASALPATGVN